MYLNLLYRTQAVKHNFEKYLFSVACIVVGDFAFTPKQ